jgi:hypothetical protein
VTVSIESNGSPSVVARLPIPNPNDDDYLLTPGEVARIFRVDPKTVSRWAQKGRFGTGAILRTPGGHVRIKWGAIRRKLNQSQ